MVIEFFLPTGKMGNAILQPLSGAREPYHSRPQHRTHAHAASKHTPSDLAGSRLLPLARENVWRSKYARCPRPLPNGQEGAGWATKREFWIRSNVWRETIFEGNAADAMAAADALIDHGLLRVKLTSEGRERTTNVRVREQIFRAFAVSKSILAWRGPSPARPDEILAARHAATMQHVMMQHASLTNGDGEQSAHIETSDLGKKLEQAVHMALNEVVVILGFSLNPDDRAFASILKAKTTILNSVLNAQVRIDETRFRPVKEDRLERILASAERSLSHLERAYGR
jgi:hypothetical protein